MAKQTRKKTSQAENASIPAHVHHSVTLIKLLVSQLQAAVCDNDHTMQQLTHAHATIADGIQHLPGENEALQQQLKLMVTAFQGHDAFNQRMEHISNALIAIEGHLDDASLRADDNAWKALGQTQGNAYTTAREHYVHNAATHSPSGKSPLYAGDAPDGGNVELF